MYEIVKKNIAYFLSLVIVFLNLIPVHAGEFAPFSLQPDDVDAGNFSVVRGFNYWSDTDEALNYVRNQLYPSNDINGTTSIPVSIEDNQRMYIMDYMYFYSNDGSAILYSGEQMRIEFHNLISTVDVNAKIDDSRKARYYLDPTKIMEVRVEAYAFDNTPVELTESDYTISFKKDGNYYDLVLNISAKSYDINRINFAWYHNYKAFNMTDYGIGLIQDIDNYYPVYNFGFINGLVKVESKESNSGLIATIIEYIKSIWDSILDLPTDIFNALEIAFNWVVDGLVDLGNALKTALSDLGTLLINALTTVKNAIVAAIDFVVTGLIDLGNFIIDGLKELFIPKDGFFKSYFDNLYNFFTVKLGVLIYPFELMARFINRFLNISSGSGIISIPNVVIFETTLISANNYNFGQAVSNFLGNMYPVYYAFVDVIFIFAFINYAKKKFDSVVGGTGE